MKNIQIISNIVRLIIERRRKHEINQKSRNVIAGHMAYCNWSTPSCKYFNSLYWNSNCYSCYCCWSSNTAW